MNGVISGLDRRGSAMSGTLPVDPVPNQSLTSLDYQSLLWLTLSGFANAIQPLFCKPFRISETLFRMTRSCFYFHFSCSSCRVRSGTVWSLSVWHIANSHKVNGAATGRYIQFFPSGLLMSSYSYIKRLLYTKAISDIFCSSASIKLKVI